MRILTVLALASGFAAAGLGLAAPASARPADSPRLAIAGSVPVAYASRRAHRIVVRQVYRRPVVVRRVYRPAPVYYGYRPVPVYYGYRPVVRTVCRVRIRHVRIGGGYYVPRRIRVCTRRY